MVTRPGFIPAAKRPSNCQRQANELMLVNVCRRENQMLDCEISAVGLAFMSFHHEDHVTLQPEAASAAESCDQMHPGCW